jgi:alpha-galactosidase
MSPAEDEAQSYASVVLAYSGGRFGRTRVLQEYQRCLRNYDASRDGLFLSNTWGDRSRDARINADFIAREVEAGARLGVDVVQIDDGWQQGRTANSAEAAASETGGAWEDFWATDAAFWQADAQRFPQGLEPLIVQARQNKMQFGLWFAPDSTNDFANWQKDAELLLQLHRELGINYYKLDAIKMHTTRGESNLHAFFDTVLRESQGRITLDLDVTAEVRPGYFSRMDTGPIFVENRYTDWRSYWPHHTLRNAWKLMHYVDPLRLRVEFLNNERNREVYKGDPLAPAAYAPDYLFATTMFCNPLGWFEVSNLPPEYVECVASLVHVWKDHRAAIFNGRIYPIGSAPDGTAWTGFASINERDSYIYLLLFRETSNTKSHRFQLPVPLASIAQCMTLAGDGTLQVLDGELLAEISTPRRYLFARVETASTA